MKHPTIKCGIFVEPFRPKNLGLSVEEDVIKYHMSREEATELARQTSDFAELNDYNVDGSTQFVELRTFDLFKPLQPKVVKSEDPMDDINDFALNGITAKSKIRHGIPPMTSRIIYSGFPKYFPIAMVQNQKEGDILKFKCMLAKYKFNSETISISETYKKGIHLKEQYNNPCFFGYRLVYFKCLCYQAACAREPYTVKEIHRTEDSTNPVSGEIQSGQAFTKSFPWNHQMFQVALKACYDLKY